MFSAMKSSMKKLWNDLAKVDCGNKLVNQFKLHKAIPNRWFDWEMIGKPTIMIIGQDWGPYFFLKKYIDQYKIEMKKEGFNYNQFLLETFTAHTEKMILKALQDGYKKKFNKSISDKDWQQLFFTVTEMFCRSGKLFRGNENFDIKGIELSLPFLKRQIEIIKPKVILALGDMAMKQLILALEIPLKYKNLTQFIDSIKSKKYFIHNGITIIPSFHPAAHVSPKSIYDRISMVWQFI